MGPLAHVCLYLFYLGIGFRLWVCLGDSLQASSPGYSGGGAGKGRRASNYVSGIWISPPIRLWLPVNWAVKFLPICAKQKWVQYSSTIVSRNLLSQHNFDPFFSWLNCISWFLAIILSVPFTYHFPFGDHFINSHNFSSRLCIDIVRRKLMLITLGTWRVE